MAKVVKIPLKKIVDDEVKTAIDSSFGQCELKDYNEKTLDFLLKIPEEAKTVNFIKKGHFNLNLKSMHGMFDNSNSMLESVDFTGLDTSSVTDMSELFFHARRLVEVKCLNKIDYSKVTKLTYMFSQCSSLKELDFSGADMSNVQYTDNMFDDCYCLRKIDFSNVKFGSLKQTGYMFEGCSSLESIVFPKTGTIKISEYISNMFYGCKKLTALDLSNFDFSEVPYYSSVFSGCTSLASLRFPASKSFDVSSTALAHDALVVLLGDLKPVTSTQTLTMGSTKLALLSDAEKKIATDKGWTLA